MEADKQTDKRTEIKTKKNDSNFETQREASEKKRVFNETITLQANSSV